MFKRGIIGGLLLLVMVLGFAYKAEASVLTKRDLVQLGHVQHREEGEADRSAWRLLGIRKWLEDVWQFYHRGC